MFQTGSRFAVFTSWTIRRKMVSSFLVLAFITLALGVGSILALSGIKQEMDALSERHLKGWRSATAIESGIRQAGYAVVTYQFGHDAAWWDRTQGALKDVRDRIAEGKAGAATTGNADLAASMTRIEAALGDYGKAVARTQAVTDKLLAARKRGETASAAFVAGITPYVEFQKTEMIRQIEAKDTEAELKIRQDRMAAGQKVLDLGQIAIAAAWRADALRDAAALKVVGETLQRLQGELGELIRVTRQEVNLKLLKSASSATDEFRAAILAIAEANEAALEAADEREAADATILDQAATAARDAERKAEMTTLSVLQESDGSIRLTAIGSAVLFLSSIVLGILIANSLSRPVVEMTGVMGRLSDGDLGVEIPAANRRDEIGRMADSIRIFKDKLVRNQELEAAQAAAEARNRKERKQALNELADTFEGSVQTIVHSVGSTAAQVHTAARAVAKVADEATGRATTVAAASEQASANVQTVATAAEELTSSIGEISRQVTRSATIARSAVAEAGNTREAVMALATAASRIGEVLGVINEIAAQTNLLALNATIEAARAGEAGKGFAVVASEVKHLAGQTARATEQITGQVTGIETASRNAVSAIDSIERTITEVDTIAATIAAAIEEQGAATQEIARNVEQAAAGTREVSANIAAVSKAVQEAGAASGQMLEAATLLTGEAQSLRQGVDGFVASVRSG